MNLGRARARRAALPWFLGILVSTGAISAAAVPGNTVRADVPAIYVSPKGNDAFPGSASQPVQSLYRAQQLVREADQNMTSDLTVYLETGTYRLTRPLTLDSQDSGSNGYRVIWTSAPSASPVISGAIPITGWKLSDPSRNIWAARVPPWLSTRQIYVNGMRASMDAGLPPVSLQRAGDAYIASTSLMEHWRNPSEIQFVYPNQLSFPAQPECPVARIKGDFIYMAQPCWNNSNDRKPDLVGWDGGFLSVPAYIENAYELLSQPGQFYLDRGRHMLFYIPRPGENMETADVEAPVLQSLINGDGTATAGVHDVTFNGIQFSYATWLQPGTPVGFSEVQSNYTLTKPKGYAYQGLCHLEPGGACPYGDWTKEPGNVGFSYDRNITFLDDRFVHLGGAGLDLGDGSQGDVVEGCVFTDISGNALELGGVDMPEAAGLARTQDDSVLNNHLYGVAVEFPGGVGILAGYIADTAISHNQIDDVPYVAISVGWGGWLDKRSQPSVPNYASGNVVSDNLIFDYMLVVKDGGGIYTQGILGPSLKLGLRVTGNVLHDQLDWGGALKADDGTTYVTYSRNVLYNDTYDWDGIHDDYRKHARTHYDPELIENNWWQQGDPNSNNKGVVEQSNTIISSQQDAPRGVVTAAGIEPPFQAVLDWRPDDTEVPNPPQLVSVLYSYQGQAYVMWHPSYAYGSSAVSSYTVTPCSITRKNPGLCRQISTSATVSRAQLDQLGYAVVPGLGIGRHYRFVVTAQNDQGSSVASLPSREVTISGNAPVRPGKPTDVWAETGSRAVSIGWYRPGNDHGPLVMARRAHSGSRKVLVLGYTVTSNTGRIWSITGLQDIIDTNTGSKSQLAISGLDPTKRYRFSIVAVTANSVSSPARTGWLNPSN